MKHLAKRARTTVLALSVAASVLSLSAVSAFAQDNAPADPGVRCAAKIGPGEYEFYLPGERATDINGNKWGVRPRWPVVQGLFLADQAAAHQAHY